MDIFKLSPQINNISVEKLKIKNKTVDRRRKKEMIVKNWHTVGIRTLQFQCKYDKLNHYWKEVLGYPAGRARKFWPFGGEAHTRIRVKRAPNCP